MMVPRAFLFSSHKQHGEMTPEKKSAMDVFAQQDTLGSLAEPPTHTSPVVIPPKRGSRMAPVPLDFKTNGTKSLKRPKTLRKTPSSDRPLPSSIASILEATAIPVPRRKWSTTRESRKLPRGKNHVDNFSQMMLDGVRSKDDGLMEGSGNTVLDILLSPPEENEKPGLVNDDDLDTPSFSGRSTSTESVPSLDHDVGSPSSLPVLSTPSSQRNPLERKCRQPSHSEDCAFDHPLLETETSEFDLDPVGQQHILTEPAAVNTPTPSRSFPRLGSSFKSNLTASLRAIKSAAQTVSTFATPSVQPDDFLTRSLFTITPELTDDRRPPPMNEPPSPALRRYLNPVTVSPAEMHVYHDYPRSTPDSNRNCPVSIQMQTYHRSGSRRGRKSSFRLPSSEGRDRQCLPFNPEIPPMSRQREPRENSDFLRIVVLEMNMRRRGKLRDDIPPRARVWLPPRKVNHNHLDSEYDDDDYDNENAIPSRWVGISVE